MPPLISPPPISTSPHIYRSRPSLHIGRVGLLPDCSDCPASQLAAHLELSRFSYSLGISRWLSGLIGVLIGSWPRSHWPWGIVVGRVSAEGGFPALILADDRKSGCGVGPGPHTLLPEQAGRSLHLHVVGVHVNKVGRVYRVQQVERGQVGGACLPYRDCLSTGLVAAFRILNSGHFRIGHLGALGL